MQEDGVDARRHSTCISEPALLSNAQVKKRVSSLLRSDVFFLACPCRLEAVTKILTQQLLLGHLRSLVCAAFCVATLSQDLRSNFLTSVAAMSFLTSLSV